MSARKKYQVFISSTFTDMKNERQAAVEAILTAGHIPAGMELFSAGDESQLEVIKQWIVDSDIYVLILGATYGSLEPKSRRSYTELEYDFAVKNNKPHFALVLSDEAVNLKRQELGITVVDNPDHLSDFRKKVLSKIASIIHDTKDIQISIFKSLREIEHRKSVVGWVRGDAADNTPLVNEITRLTDKNQQLESELQAAKSAAQAALNGAPLADMDDKIDVAIEYRCLVGRPGGAVRFPSNNTEIVKITWSRLFALFSPKLIDNPSDAAMRSYIAKKLLDSNGIRHTHRSASLDKQTHGALRTHYEALGLIAVSSIKSTAGAGRLYWILTARGKSLMQELRVVRKAPE